MKKTEKKISSDELVIPPSTLTDLTIGKDLLALSMDFVIFELSLVSIAIGKNVDTLACTLAIAPVTRILVPIMIGHFALSMLLVFLELSQ
jgi:hypothetical protein